MAKNKLSHEELLFKLMKAYADSDIIKEERAARYKNFFDYYTGDAPRKMNDTECRAVPVVATAVQNILPDLLSIYTSDEKSATKVRALEGKMPSLLAQELTKAINAVALSDNQVRRLYNDIFLEVLIYGDSFVKISKEHRTLNEYSKQFEDMEEAELDLILQTLLDMGYKQADIHIQTDKNEVKTLTKKEREDRANILGVPVQQIPKKVTLLTGSIKAKLMEHKIKINHLPMEEVYVPSRLRGSISEARYFCHKITTTKDEALALGYDANDFAGSDDNESQAEYFNSSRTSGLGVVNDYDTYDDDCDQVVILEHYWKGILDNNVEHLYKISTDESCKRILNKYDVLTGKWNADIEKIDYIPVANFKCYPLAGSFWANSIVDWLAPLQDLKTRLQRTILANSESAANGRWLAIKGQYDKRSLLDNRPGGVVEITQPNAITPMAYHQLPNSTMELMNEVDETIGEVVQGAKGFSSDMAEMNNMSGVALQLLQNEDKTASIQIAHNIGEGFKELFSILLNMMQEMGHPLQIAGRAVDIRMIASDLDFIIDIDTIDDDALKAQNMINFLSTAIQQNGGVIPKYITDENLFNIYKEYLVVATGDADVSAYITAPEDLPQPSEIELKLQAALSAAQVRMQFAETQLAEAKVTEMKAEIENKLSGAAKNYADMQKTMSDIDNDKIELLMDKQMQEHQKVMDEMDMTIKKKQFNADMDIAVINASSGVQPVPYI